MTNGLWHEERNIYISMAEEARYQRNEKLRVATDNASLICALLSARNIPPVAELMVKYLVSVADAMHSKPTKWRVDGRATADMEG